MSITIEKLSNELLVEIFSHLPMGDLAAVRRVSRRFNQIVEDHLDYIRFSLNQEKLFSDSLTKRKLTHVFFPGDYRHARDQDRAFLTKYTAWARIHKIYYTIKAQTIYSGVKEPFKELITTCSKTELSWIKVSSRFLATVDSENSAEVYFRNPVKHLKSFSLPPFKFMHLVDNHIYLVDLNNSLRKWNLLGNEIQLEVPVQFESDCEFVATDRLLIYRRNGKNLVLNLENQRSSDLNFSCKVEAFDEDDVILSVPNGTVRLERDHSWNGALQGRISYGCAKSATISKILGLCLGGMGILGFMVTVAVTKGHYEQALPFFITSIALIVIGSTVFFAGCAICRDEVAEVRNRERTYLLLDSLA